MAAQPTNNEAANAELNVAAEIKDTPVSENTSEKDLSDSDDPESEEN